MKLKSLRVKYIQAMKPYHFINQNPCFYQLHFQYFIAFFGSLLKKGILYFFLFFYENKTTL